MYQFDPSPDYRLGFKKGMKGTDVAAWQLNLKGAIVDGVFGPQTKASVIKFQTLNNLVGDGVIGPITMQTLVRVRSNNATVKHDIPEGFLMSIALNESRFNVAAVANHHGDVGQDVGPFQRSSGNTRGSQLFYRDSYLVETAAEWSATRAKQFHNSVPLDPKPSQYFTDLAGGVDKDKFRWQMTILQHNWPVAATNIPKYGTALRSDPAYDDEEADWVVEASYGRLRTPRQWVMNYIEKSTVLVQW